MAKAKKNKNVPRVMPKGKSDFGKPDLSVYVGRHTKRIHLDIRLTAAEERGLLVDLRKRHPTW